MNIQNIPYILMSNYIINTGMCTIIEGAAILAPATIAGNSLECVTQNKMVQTAAKTLQSATTAFLGIWATVHILDHIVDYPEDYWNYMGLTLEDAPEFVAAVALSIPLLFQLAKYVSPKNQEKIENFQKSYATAMKIINIMTAGIALGWWSSIAVATWGLSSAIVTPLVLSAVSLASSVYTLHRNEQSQVTLQLTSP